MSGLNVDFQNEDIPERGVVLTGRIFSASNLPFTDGTERDGRVFFRVLYVEGGAESTLFRCKTAIFKSSLANDLNSPEWNEGSFRFEMMLPDGQDENGLQGEILIALYRNRGLGGSDFIGQASFQLSEIIRLLESYYLLLLFFYLLYTLKFP